MTQTTTLNKASKWVKLFFTFLPFYFFTFTLSSCSESEDEETDEYANWEERNDSYLNNIVSQCKANSDGNWMRLKSCYKNSATEGKATDYVYVHKVEQGSGTESPLATDSVRVSYQGRLIPSKTYSEGFVFDGTVFGTYNTKTNATVKFLASSVIEGWTTALLHMHRGDYWRIYVPYQMGYGSSGSSNGEVPGYSVLIFDLTLVDFSPAGEVVPVWSSRRR